MSCDTKRLIGCFIRRYGRPVDLLRVIEMFMSFHEWSAAERVEIHKQFLLRVEDPPMFHINT